MSTETRMWVADNLVFKAESQRAQILDTNATNTWLIALLQKAIKQCPRKILVTALNTDHASGTWHNPYGRAIDCWNADWATEGDEKVVDVMRAFAIAGADRQPALIEVGLSGTAAYYKSYVTFPTSNVFIEDYGKNNEHLHFACGAPG